MPGTKGLSGSSITAFHATHKLCLSLLRLSQKEGNYSAGGSKGPARPLGGVRGKEAWEAYVPAFLLHPAAAGGARAKKPA